MHIPFQPFGELAVIGLFVTAFLGFKIRKFGMKAHKISAITTIVCALLHVILQKI
ncbi:MAG: hypothetical protein GX445_08190 [Elusimicrobia bacterium]|nr:hypothetical protein [Elusimicrobiota bacterium]